MKTIIGLFFVIFFLFIPVISAAQPVTRPQYDSFIRIYHKGVVDTFSVFALFRISMYHYEKGNYDSALFYSKKSIGWANQTGSGVHITRALYNTGAVLMETQRLDSSVYYLEKALEKALHLANSELAMLCYHALAINCNARSDYDGSVMYQLKAAAIIEKSDFPLKKQYNTQTYGNIGVNLSEEKQYDKAITYYRKALSDSLGLCAIY